MAVLPMRCGQQEYDGTRTSDLINNQISASDSYFNTPKLPGEVYQGHTAYSPLLLLRYYQFFNGRVEHHPIGAGQQMEHNLVIAAGQGAGQNGFAQLVHDTHRAFCR